MPAVALGGLVGTLALAAPAAADPAGDASTEANIKPLVLDHIPAGGSNPSADKTIWLDFAGGTVSHTSWNDHGNSGKDIKYAPANKLSDAQKLVVYQRIVQSYAPFEVNVTTKKPSAGDLRRSSLDDDRYGAIVHVTDSNGKSPGLESIFGDAAGKAELSSFGDPYRYNAWVTTDLFAPSVRAKSLKVPLGQRQSQESMASIEDKLLAYEAGSNAVHELGHTVGLEHQGFGNQEYYTPGYDLTKANIWGPHMGNATAAGLERWTNGFPGGSNNGQDDMALITKDLSKKDAEVKRVYDGKLVWSGGYCTYPDSDKVVKADKNQKCLENEPLRRQNDYNGRLDYRKNQEANSDGVARPVTIENGKGSVWGEFVSNLGKGVGNWYRFDAAAGAIKLDVTPQAPFSVLDLKVTLYDAKLNQIATADPGLKNVFDSEQIRVSGVLEGQGASINHAGVGNQTYFVKVEQSSFGDMDDNTADQSVASPKYGGQGAFQVAVAANATAELAAPTVDPTYGKTVTGTGVPGAVVDVDNEGGKLIGSATVGPDGKYSVKLDPAAKVGDELLVSQSQEGLKSRPVAVTVVSEEKPEVKVKVDPTKITEGDKSGVAVIGTGFESGQKVTGVVNSEPVDLGTKIADDKGRVEFVFDASKLEVGKHKVTLTAVGDKDYAGSAKLTVSKADETTTTRRRPPRRPRMTTSRPPRPRPRTTTTARRPRPMTRVTMTVCRAPVPVAL